MFADDTNLFCTSKGILNLSINIYEYDYENNIRILFPCSCVCVNVAIVYLIDIVKTPTLFIRVV